VATYHYRRSHAGRSVVYRESPSLLTDPVSSVIGSVAAVNPRFRWGKWRNDGWEAHLTEHAGVVGRGRTRDEAVDDALRQAGERGRRGVLRPARGRRSSL
jgi:hypothetical protein